MKVFQSVDVRYPLTEVVAAGMLRWLAAVPDPVRGASDVTAVK